MRLKMRSPYQLHYQQRAHFPVACSLNAGRRCSRDSAGSVCVTRQAAVRQTFKSVTLVLCREVDSKRLKLQRI